MKRISFTSNIHQYHNTIIYSIVISGLLFLYSVNLASINAFDPQGTDYVFVRNGVHMEQEMVNSNEYTILLLIHQKNVCTYQIEMVIVYRYLTKMEHSFSNGVRRGTGDGQFTVPYSVDVDSQGECLGCGTEVIIAS